MLVQDLAQDISTTTVTIGANTIALRLLSAAEENSIVDVCPAARPPMKVNPNVGSAHPDRLSPDFDDPGYERARTQRERRIAIAILAASIDLEPVVYAHLNAPAPQGETSGKPMRFVDAQLSPSPDAMADWVRYAATSLLAALTTAQLVRLDRAYKALGADLESDAKKPL